MRKRASPQGAHIKNTRHHKTTDRKAEAEISILPPLYEAKKVISHSRSQWSFEARIEPRCQSGLLGSSSGQSGHLYLCEWGIKPTAVGLGPPGCMCPGSAAPQDAEQKHLLVPGHICWMWGDPVPSPQPKEPCWETAYCHPQFWEPLLMLLAPEHEHFCPYVLQLPSHFSYPLINPGHMLQF